MWLCVLATCRTASPALRIAMAACDTALLPLQLTFSRPKVVWSFDALAGREGNEVVQTHIEPHRYTRVNRFFVGIRHVDLEDRRPSVPMAFGDDLLDRRIARQGTMPFYFERTDALEAESIIAAGRPIAENKTDRVEPGL